MSKTNITADICATSRWRCRGAIIGVLVVLGGLFAGWAWGNSDKISDNAVEIRANSTMIQNLREDMQDVKEDTRYIRKRLDEIAGK